MQLTLLHSQFPLLFAALFDYSVRDIPTLTDPTAKSADE
jgi:hypothetical protein